MIRPSNRAGEALVFSPGVSWFSGLFYVIHKLKSKTHRTTFLNYVIFKPFLCWALKSMKAYSATFYIPVSLSKDVRLFFSVHISTNASRSFWYNVLPSVFLINWSALKRLSQAENCLCVDTALTLPSEALSDASAPAINHKENAQLWLILQVKCLDWNASSHFLNWQLKNIYYPIPSFILYSTSQR